MSNSQVTLPGHLRFSLSTPHHISTTTITHIITIHPHAPGHGPRVLCAAACPQIAVERPPFIVRTGDDRRLRDRADEIP